MSTQALLTLGARSGKLATFIIALFMKPKIHPTYFKEAKVVCACGHKFVTGSTVEEIHTEICSKCHPFYTGKQNLVDTARRVEKFQEKAGKQMAAAATRKGKKAKTAKSAARKAAKADKLIEK